MILQQELRPRTTSPEAGWLVESWYILVVPGGVLHGDCFRHVHRRADHTPFPHREIRISVRVKLSKDCVWGTCLSVISPAPTLFFLKSSIGVRTYLKKREREGRLERWLRNELFVTPASGSSAEGRSLRAPALISTYPTHSPNPTHIHRCTHTVGREA